MHNTLLLAMELQISEAFRFGEGDFADAAKASAALEVATALVDAFGIVLEVTLPRRRAGEEEGLKAQRSRIEEVGAQHGLDGSRLLVREQPATSEESPKITARLSFREPKVLTASVTRPPARSWRLSWAQGA